MDCLPRTPTGGFLAALRSRSIFDTSGSLMPAPGRVLSENTKRNECKGRLQMACVQQVGVQMACVQQVGGVGQMGEQHLTPPLRRLRFLGVEMFPGARFLASLLVIGVIQTGMRSIAVVFVL